MKYTSDSAIGGQIEGSSGAASTATSSLDGVCERCDDPEVDEVAAVECPLCAAIFEHTGGKQCPVHGSVTEDVALPLQPTPRELLALSNG